MKKLMLTVLCLLLALPLCAAASAATASAATASEEPVQYTSSDYTYILLPDGTAEITYYSGKETNLTLPDTLDGYRVTSIGDYAFSYCSRLTSVSIPDSVTSIGKNAFYNCDSLTSVSIGDSVTSIGDEAFSYCDSLTSVSIPDSVTSVGANSFLYCDNLTSIFVSEEHPLLETIDGVLFDKQSKTLICCPSAFDEVAYEIPQGILAIGADAFYNCNSLTSVSIPDSVTSIGEDAFSSCDSLTSVSIPDSVTSIGEDAFYNCKNLTLAVAPSSYAETYAKENNIPYTYSRQTSSTDWLNN